MPLQYNKKMLTKDYLLTESTGSNNISSYIFKNTTIQKEMNTIYNLNEFINSDTQYFEGKVIKIIIYQIQKLSDGDMYEFMNIIGPLGDKYSINLR